VDVSICYLRPARFVAWTSFGYCCIGINMLGDAARDILDPRLRGGIGRYGTVKIKKTAETRDELTLIDCK